MSPTRNPGRPRPVRNLTRIAAGEQPQRNGYLLCLLCGQWYRSVGRHLQPAHGISPDAYKEQFELPAGRGLVADDLRELFAARQTELLRTNEGVRKAFGLDEPNSPERRRRLEKGRRRGAQTATRAGVRLGSAARLAARNTARAKQLLQEYNQRARRRGYNDLQHLLRETTHLPYSDFRDLMGWSEGQIYQWRRTFGLSSTSAKAKAVRRGGGLPAT